MSILNAKRNATFYVSANSNSKKKQKLDCDCYVFWKTWLLVNYEFKLESLTTIQSILNHSACTGEKENIPDTLSVEILGKLIRDIWNGKVERVQRGRRGEQIWQFLHLSEKTPHHMQSSLPSSIRNVKVLTNWKAININDKFVKYVRLENWQVNNRCATTELSIEYQNEEIGKVILWANGLKTEVNDHELNTKEQIEQFLEFVDKATLCEGYYLEPGENIAAMLPHHLERITSMEDVNAVQTVAFSNECSILLRRAGDKSKRCTSCANLKKIDCHRKKRKQNRDAIHPKCNRRYLGKIDIEKQLDDAKKEKANCTKREEYWREKFEAQTIELESEDHGDFTSVLNSVDENKVPADMKILWEQQRKIINTKSQHGYRWHPK